MWLTGYQIQRAVYDGDITIEPYSRDLLNSNSYNYQLAPKLLRLTNEIIDTKFPDKFEEIVIPPEGYILQPNECYLGNTVEIFGSNVYASLVTGRSSIGRRFVTNHVTAGLIDQGFFGTITLEITAQKPTRVYPGLKFGQIFWYVTYGKPLLYPDNAGKYMHQAIPTPSKSYLDR